MLNCLLSLLSSNESLLLHIGDSFVILTGFLIGDTLNEGDFFIFSPRLQLKCLVSTGKLGLNSIFRSIYHQKNLIFNVVDHLNRSLAYSTQFDFVHMKSSENSFLFWIRAVEEECISDHV